MRKSLRMLVALLMAALVLAGCTGGSLREKTDGMNATQTTEAGGKYITNEDLVYTRPDLEELEQLLEDACQIAQSGSVREIMDAVYSFYDAYDWFYTCYALADIRYSADLTDTYWEEEYSFCLENSPTVDAALEELMYALAQSPQREKLEGNNFFGEGYFDDYDGENQWDAEFTRLLEQESELQSRYYALSEEALRYESGSRRLYDNCADDMAQLLVELITLRKEIAAYWGYDTYEEFAWDFYYYRDYTPEQAMDYYLQISEYLVPLYRETADSDAWDELYAYANEEDAYQYVRHAAEGMGGMIWEAFEVMERGELYDITYGENKYDSSFEIYLTSYSVPFVFMNPERSRYDLLTFAHEFGHFCNDYASYGSYAGIDVAEVFSQGMEYLSLCYTQDAQALSRGKLADSLATYVEQTAFACFEQRMYALEGDALSVEGLYELYDEVAREFGFESVGYDRREFVEINHFYTNPMYIVSYVVSNDAAMQLYQRELEQPGAGAALLEEHLDTQEEMFLAFVESAGLESPFAQGRLESVRDTFADALS